MIHSYNRILFIGNKKEVLIYSTTSYMPFNSISAAYTLQCRTAG